MATARLASYRLIYLSFFTFLFLLSIPGKAFPEESPLSISTINSQTDADILRFIPSITVGTHIKATPLYSPSPGSILNLQSNTGTDITIFAEIDATGLPTKITSAKYKFPTGGSTKLAPLMTVYYDANGVPIQFDVEEVGVLTLSSSRSTGATATVSSTGSAINQLGIYLSGKLPMIWSGLEEQFSRCPNVWSFLKQPPQKPTVMKYGQLTLDSGTPFIGGSTFLEYNIGPANPSQTTAIATEPTYYYGRYTSNNTYTALVSDRLTEAEYNQTCGKNYRSIVAATQCFVDLTDPANYFKSIRNSVVSQLVMDKETSDAFLFIVETIIEGAKRANLMRAGINGIADYDTQLIDNMCKDAFKKYNTVDSRVSVSAYNGFTGHVDSKTFNIYTEAFLPSLSISYDTCQNFSTTGYDDGTTVNIDMGKNSGTFVFNYDTYSIPDRIKLKHGSKLLFDTGCVGSYGSTNITMSVAESSSRFITVTAEPNCNGTTGTAWSFSIGCPSTSSAPNVTISSTSPSSDANTIEEALVRLRRGRP
ncbi:MAG: hypothetical protein ACLGQW_10605 [Acidobacteriota bacterium]